MKKMFNKICKTLLVIALLFSAVAPSINTIAAATYNVQERFLGNWSAVAGGSEALVGNGTVLTVNGQVSFCLQANKAASSGGNNAINPGDIGLSEDTMSKLALIAWYGYKSQPNDDNYMLTQNLIWQETGYLSYYRSSTYTNKASMQGFFNEVMNRVNNFDNTPSFHAKTYTMNLGETLTLEDTNGVLDGLSVGNVTGATITKNGNTLSITPSQDVADTITIKFDRGLSLAQTSTNFVVRSGNSQAISPCLSGDDPYGASVRIKINKFGSLELAKQDNKTNFVPNTSFKLSYSADMTNPIGTYTTGVSGKVKVDELLPQTVYIQETAVPDHLMLDSTIYSKSIVSNTTTAYSAVNNWKQGYIQAVKKDLDSGKVVKKAGTTFNVHKTDNTLVATITTGADGIAKTGLLDYGDYYLQETKAPSGFTIDATKYPINVRNNLATVEQIVSNKEVRGTITLTKEDSETGGTAQGSATLLGAKYKLYAKSNIIDPADGSILISANSLISEKEVDANRKISWDNLYLGDYYAQESVAPTGYNIDPNKHNVTLSYANQNTAIISKTITSKEDVIRGDIYLVKYLDDSINNPSLQEPGKDIVFKITSKTTGSDFFIKTNEHGHASTKVDYYTDEACTNKVSSNARGALPFDTYTIEEVASTTPPGFIPAGKWEATISAQGSVLHYIIKNTDINSPVIVVKADKTTGNTIPMANTEFELYDKDMNLVTMTTRYPSTVVHKSFKTDENGQFQFPEMVPWGKYFLKEINAPEGYLKGELLEFDVSSSEEGNWDTPLVITYYDDPAMGKANIQKLDDSTNDGVANTVIGIYAREDIVTADGTTRALKDELVDTVTTIKYGKATTKELFLGKYYTKEIKQAPGFALSDQEYDFELTYKDQETPIVEVDVEMTNSPTKLKLIKTLLDSDKRLEGIRFKIVNKDMETAINTAVDGVGDDWMFGVVTDALDQGFNQGTDFYTNENGEIDISYLMPGTYTIQEIETLDGLVLDSTVHEFTIDENGLINGSDLYVLNITNAPTKVEFDKTNEDGSIRLAGAYFNFIDKETGKVVIKDYVTTTDSKIFEGIFVSGRTYIARETKAPEGYIASKDIEFAIENISNVQTVTIENSKILTQVEVVKVDADTKEVIKDSNFEFTMYSDKDCTDEVLVVKADTKNGTATFKDIEYGQTVYIKETNAPEGYLLSDEVKELILDQTLDGIGATHSFNFENSKVLTQIQVNKVDSQTNLPVISKDFQFTMFSDKECTQVLDVVHADTSDGTATFKDAEYGQTVYIKETNAPAGYKLSDEVKEILLDMNLDGIGEVHSFVYLNTILGEEIITATNDTSNIEVYALVLIGSAYGIYMYFKKKNRKNQKEDI